MSQATTEALIARLMDPVARALKDVDQALGLTLESAVEPGMVDTLPVSPVASPPAPRPVGALKAVRASPPASVSPVPPHPAAPAAGPADLARVRSELAPLAAQGGVQRGAPAQTGYVDLSPGRGGLQTVEGRDNLAQALTLRLLVGAGELAALGHPGYSSRIRELIGEPLGSANVASLRRYVRKALMRDSRVAEVLRVDVRPKRDQPGTMDVYAAVRPGAGRPVQVSVELYVG